MQKQSCVINCDQHKQPIQFVCFDQVCQKSNTQLLCHACLQAHSQESSKFLKHHLIEYCHFKEDLQALKKQIRYDHLIEILKNEIEELRKKLNSSLNQLEDRLMSSINLEFHEELEEQIFRGELSTLTQNKYLNMFLVDKKPLEAIQKDITEWSIFTAKSLRSISDRTCQELEHITFKLSESNAVSAIKSQSGQFRFDEKSKNRSIEILNSGNFMRKLNKEGIGHCQLALTSEPLSPVNNKIIFQIQETTRFGCTAIGVCIKDIVAKNVYYKCWRLGEGTYSVFVNTFGDVKTNHHTKSEHSNRIVPNWGLIRYDKVIVEVDFMREEITFTRINQGRHFKHTMPVDIDQGKLYPFAAVSYPGHQVAIVRH